MREGRNLVGLQVSHTAVMGENGVIRKEVLNTIARQVKTLRDEGCDVFIFISQVAEYCLSEEWTRGLRATFGKICALRQYARAFARRRMQICPLDGNIGNINKLLSEALSYEMVPIISIGDCECHASVAGSPRFVSEDIYFACLCSMAKADVAVIVADKEEVNMRINGTEKYFSSDMDVKTVVYYQPDFLLDAVDPTSNPKYRAA